MKPNREVTPEHVRSISYAPESIRPSRQTKPSTPDPAWILCRNLHQCPIDNDESLLRWTEQGRVRPSDYLVNTRLDRCFQARDLTELDAIFRGSTARRLATAAWALAIAGLALVWVAPLLGSVVAFSAVATTLISKATQRSEGGLT